MNKTVLITGASSGIGLELSKIFARNNYNLVLVSQNEENLRKAASIIHKENTEITIYAIAKDLSKVSSPQEIFDYTIKNSIQVDILVNNAGIQVYGNFHDTNMDDILKLMNVNMFAMTKLTRLFVEGMIKRGHGKILNVASTGAFQPCPLNAVYCASKAFVLYTSEAIGEEMKGTGVTVTALCPGATRTNFAKRAKIENTKLFRGKVSEPSKVAEMGYKGLMKGKSVVVTGVSNKLITQSVRIIPRNMVTKIGMNMMRE